MTKHKWIYDGNTYKYVNHRHINGTLYAAYRNNEFGAILVKNESDVTEVENIKKAWYNPAILFGEAM